jgi:hypothetical protein
MNSTLSNFKLKVSSDHLGDQIVRSEILSETLGNKNRFAFCHLVFKAIRKLHKPSNRIQDTANDVLQRLAGLEGQRVSANAGDENKLAVLDVKRKRGQAGAIPESLASAVKPLDGTAIAPGELIQKAS